MASLSSLSFMSTVDGFAIPLLVLAVILLSFWVFRLERRLDRMLRGSKTGSLEDVLTKLQEGHKDFRSFETSMEKYLDNAEKRLRRSVQKIETIRFDPFKGNGDGGKQSFATAFLSEEGDGVIVSSLYARDRMSVFTKPVTKFSSPHELTEEEAEVLKKGRESLTTKP